MKIYPRVFAMGTAQKPYTTCTTNRDDYSDSTEPIDISYHPNAFDAKRARGKPYTYLMKPLKPGPLHIAVRGKQIDVATEHVSDIQIHNHSLLTRQCCSIWPCVTLAWRHTGSA
jgi:hypothetical protein